MAAVLLPINIKNENKIAADWLLNYQGYREMYIENKQKFSALSATVYTGMPHGSGVGNPSVQKYLSLAEIELQKLWVMTIENAESCLSEKRRAFLEFRRRAVHMTFNPLPGRPGWLAYVQVRYADWHRQKYGREYVPSDRSMHAWWDDIVDLTVRIAIRRGCL